MRKKSEFGRGLVVCLVKFAEHFENRMADFFIYDKWMNETPKNRELMLSPKPPSHLNYGSPHMQNLRFFVEHEIPIWKTPKKAMSQKIELWLNGASDHLYDIQVPKGKSWDEIRVLVKRLRKKGLTMGHGFSGKIWTIDDVKYLMRLTRRIALMIDKKFGLDADLGEW